MLEKCEIVDNSTEKYKGRYKICVKGDMETVEKLLNKIDSVCLRPVCGKLMRCSDREFVWEFFIYQISENDHSQISDILNRAKESDEILVVERKDWIISPSEFKGWESERVADLELSPNYTFENYIVGANNHFAQAAAMAVADNPGMTYNPLFIYGNVGLGKTHLMQAIGHDLLRKNQQSKVLYVTSEKFMADVINAIRYGKILEFRNKFRSLDLLLIDDVQFLSEAEAAQEEFFHTFNALYESRKQIVITSDSPPKKIPILEERVRSRFEWGLIVDLHAPNLETRVAILKKKADKAKITILDDVLRFIADRLKTNVRELEGFLIRIVAYAALTSRQISVELADQLMIDLFPGEPGKTEFSVLDREKHEELKEQESRIQDLREQEEQLRKEIDERLQKEADERKRREEELKSGEDRISSLREEEEHLKQEIEERARKAEGEKENREAEIREEEQRIQLLRQEEERLKKEVEIRILKEVEMKNSRDMEIIEEENKLDALREKEKQLRCEVEERIRKELDEKNKREAEIEEEAKKLKALQEEEEQLHKEMHEKARIEAEKKKEEEARKKEDKLMTVQLEQIQQEQVKQEPQLQEEVKEVDKGLRPIKVGFLYPAGKEDELELMKKGFTDTIIKHKIKFRLENVFDITYSENDLSNLNGLLEQYSSAQVRVAICLGPLPDSVLYKERFIQKIGRMFEKAEIAFQSLPFDDISKQYKYLDLCLDLAFVKS